MLRIYPTTLLMARDAALAASQIQRHDTDLARQLRRAAASVPLNTAEGSGSRGGNRKARYSDALGSAYETRACLQVAAAMGYLPEPSPEVAQRLDGIIAVLFTLTR